MLFCKGLPWESKAPVCPDLPRTLAAPVLVDDDPAKRFHSFGNPKRCIAREK